MVDITLGTQSDYSTSSVYYEQIVTIDATHIAVVYRAGGGIGYVVVGVVSGNNITSWGSSVSLGSVDNEKISISVLDSTHLIITYRSNGGGFAVVGVISSGTIITLGTAVEYNTTNPITNYGNVDALSSTKFIVGFQADHTGIPIGVVRIGSVSGTTITYGSPVTFKSNAVSQITVRRSDGYGFVICYRDGVTGYCYVKNGQHNGGTFIWNTGGDVTVNAANTEYINMDMKPGGSKIFVVYRDTGGSSYGCGKCATITGVQVSLGSEVVFNSAVTTWCSCGYLTGDRWVVSYITSSDDVYSRIMTSSGNEISEYGTAIVSSTDNCNNLECCGIDKRFANVYNRSNTNGSVRIGAMLFTFTPKIIIS